MSLQRRSQIRPTFRSLSTRFSSLRLSPSFTYLRFFFASTCLLSADCFRSCSQKKLTLTQVSSILPSVFFPVFDAIEPSPSLFSSRSTRLSRDDGPGSPRLGRVGRTPFETTSRSDLRSRRRMADCSERRRRGGRTGERLRIFLSPTAAGRPLIFSPLSGHLILTFVTFCFARRPTRKITTDWTRLFPFCSLRLSKAALVTSEIRGPEPPRPTKIPSDSTTSLEVEESRLPRFLTPRRDPAADRRCLGSPRSTTRGVSR